MLVAIALGVTSSCGSAAEDDATTATVTAPSSAPADTEAPVGQRNEEAPVTVELGAIEEQADGDAIEVTGYLVEDTGMVLLAEFLAESFPPQAAGVVVGVDGLDVDAVDELQAEGPIRWVNEPITIRGTVEGGRLVNAELADN